MGHDWSSLEMVEVARGLRFPEGPVAMPDGTVLVGEIQGGVVSRVHPDGRIETVAECGGGPNGLAVSVDEGAAGIAYVCNNGGFFDYDGSSGINIPTPGSAGWAGGSIQRVDLATGATTVLYDACDGRGLRAPNDLVLDGAGGIWFTDHGIHADDEHTAAGHATVFWAATDGSVVRPVARGLDAPNGIGLSPAGDRLYVAETYRARLLAWDVVGAGELGPGDPDVLVDLGGSAMFDSLGVDSEGSVCVATLLTGGITVVPAGGGEPAFVPTGDPMTTNICFGGDDGRAAWITASGSGRLVRTTWLVPGI